jgi:hypothetical protein
MTGYSGKPLRQKLELAAGTRLAVFNPPDNYFELLGDTDGIDFAADFDAPLDAAHAFVTTTAELRQLVAGLLPALALAGKLWVSWPKQSAGVESDLNENVIRDVILPLGLVDVKVCAVDDTWSGLKLVRRKGQ